VMPPTWMIWFACVWALLTFALVALFTALLAWARARAPKIDLQDALNVQDADGLRLLSALDEDTTKEEQDHIERSHG